MRNDKITNKTEHFQLNTDHSFKAVTSPSFSPQY
jgi:hypothetical protein